GLRRTPAGPRPVATRPVPPGPAPTRPERWRSRRSPHPMPVPAVPHPTPVPPPSRLPGWWAVRPRPPDGAARTDPYRHPPGTGMRRTDPAPRRRIRTPAAPPRTRNIRRTSPGRPDRTTARRRTRRGDRGTTSDLEQLGFLVFHELVHHGHVPVGHVLEFLLRAADLVLAGL